MHRIVMHPEDDVPRSRDIPAPWNIGIRDHLNAGTGPRWHVHAACQGMRL